MKKQIILCGMVAVIALVLSYRYWYSPTSYGFVGTVISMENNILVLKGLPDGVGVSTAQEITVNLVSTTKISRKGFGENGLWVEVPATMDDLYDAVQKGGVLMRLSADYDFYATSQVTPEEIIYTTAGSGGSI